MDGILVIDKPDGMTSHDVVAVARRALRESRIGHTGTLDPLATGVLPLAVGKATRLVRFLTASDKTYDATILFGLSTDTYDIAGRETARTDGAPAPDAIAAALPAFSGEYLQTPPAYSAKKVAGQRAYDLARRNEEVVLAPVPVRVAALELLSVDGVRCRVRLTCSAGFYVRSLAHDLGQRLGTGACLEALRRTRSGEFGLDRAVPLDTLSRNPEEARHRFVAIRELLPDMPAVTLTTRGLQRVSHGQAISPADLSAPSPGTPPWVRLLDDTGGLAALAVPGTTAGTLHPEVVLT